LKKCPPRPKLMYVHTRTGARRDLVPRTAFPSPHLTSSSQTAPPLSASSCRKRSRVHICRSPCPPYPLSFSRVWLTAAFFCATFFSAEGTPLPEASKMIKDIPAADLAVNRRKRTRRGAENAEPEQSAALLSLSFLSLPCGSLVRSFFMSHA